MNENGNEGEIGEKGLLKIERFDEKAFWVFLNWLED